MRWVYKILRTVIVTAIVLGFVIPALIYVLLALPPVQGWMRSKAENELSKLLGVEVKIGEVEVRPFNRVEVLDIALINDGDTLATLHRLGAGISISRMLDDELVFNYAEIVGLDARISRPAPGEPLNIQPIIDALSPKDPSKPPTKFDFAVNTVIIRQSSASYDVLSEPQPQPGRFDPNHIKISDLRADITLPRIANDDFTFELMQVEMNERSGLSLNDLSGWYHVTDTCLTAVKPVVEVNNSKLLLSDIVLTYSSFATMASDIAMRHHELSILEGTKFIPSDFAPFVPALADIAAPLSLTADLEGKLDTITVNNLAANGLNGALDLQLGATVTGLPDMERLKVAVPKLDLTVDCNGALPVLCRFAAVGTAAESLLSRAGRVELSGNGLYSKDKAAFDGYLSTDAGRVVIDAAATSPCSPAMGVTGSVQTEGFNLGALLDNHLLGLASLKADISARLSRGKLADGSFDGEITRFDFRGHEFTGITANVECADGQYVGSLNCADPDADIDLSGSLRLDGEMPQADVKLLARGVNLGLFGVKPAYADYRATIVGSVMLAGRNIDEAVATLSIDRLRLVKPGKTIALNGIYAQMDNQSQPHTFMLDSEVISGRVEGDYNVTHLPAAVKDIAASVLPSLIGQAPGAHAEAECPDNLQYNFTLKHALLDSIFPMPVSLASDVKISGALDGAAGDMSLRLLAPYVIKGGTMFRDASIGLDVTGGETPTASLCVTALAETKKDKIDFSVMSDARADRVETQLGWSYDRPKRYEGTVSLASAFSRGDDGALLASIDVNPSQFAVADTVWRVGSARVDIAPRRFVADGISVGREGQHININGIVSDNPGDSVLIQLRDIDLDYIFETLAIDNVMFGGVATGEIVGRDLLSANPQLATRDFNVERLTYNHSLMGDAAIKSAWDNETQGITIYADISQPNGCRSTVDGVIYPMAESLDFRFDADRIGVGFMQPFMSAFASSVEGYASGKAHLFGTFKLIDMTGDIYAEDLKIKLDFTNTYYTASAPVKLTEGHISFKNVVISDMYGNHGILNGWLTHECFKRPRFQFEVSDTKNLLVYDVRRQSDEDRWYGRVFADNGSATVKGHPGYVGIEVNLETAPNSTFTFELSDAETAYDYDFITFRRKGGEVIEGDVVAVEPPKVLEWQRARDHKEEDNPSEYEIDITVKVDEDAEVVIVMDPVGGDRIRSYGSGDLRLTYNSRTEEVKMWGSYTLKRGKYNFTLQDIIIKDFVICEGSEIRFNEDPYAAQLNIKAEYVVTANLSDLDESFLSDSDLNRTSLPVHAQMYITGDMRVPAIKFDIDVPTVNSDINRKIHAIISTDEMMNRQIVYLLTLGRFYTPEYMSSTTKGSELFSMASSTLSSQLRSMLGQINDNWSIAPQVRSDRGDFTDVEVDLALSSHLLNNRLLLNGNFGYRDKALNNNSFIGDFDIEYLLNRTGTIRLKAYNRYNDQNYFVKTALTTQGVGVSFRRDFDNFSYFLMPWRKEGELSAPEPVEAAPADSVAPLPPTDK